MRINFYVKGIRCEGWETLSVMCIISGDGGSGRYFKLESFFSTFGWVVLAAVGRRLFGREVEVEI